MSKMYDVYAKQDGTWKRKGGMNADGTSAKPIEISTEAEMNAIISDTSETNTEKVGDIYKYTGTTTDIYEYGAIYEVFISEKEGTLYFEKLIIESESSGSAAPQEISTEAEMTSLLATAEVGTIYKYTGESGVFESGAYYVLEDGTEHISFSINQITYQAEQGMTWGKWVASDYNTGNYKAAESDDEICPNGIYSVLTHSMEIVAEVVTSDIIKADTNYAIIVEPF